MQTALVPFHQDSVLTVFDEHAAIRPVYEERSEVLYVVCRRVAENLTENWGGWLQTLQADKFLSPKLKSIAIYTVDEKQRLMECLPIKYLPIWLAGISTNRIRPDRADKLLLYKEECAEVLYRHWFPAQAVTQATEVDRWFYIQQMAAGIVDVKTNVDDLLEWRDGLYTWKGWVDQEVGKIDPLIAKLEEEKEQLLEKLEAERQARLRYEKEELRRRRNAREYFKQIEFSDAAKAHFLEIWPGRDCMNPTCDEKDLFRRRVQQWDHVIPTARGGRNSIANMGLLCKWCNNEFRDKLKVDYRPLWLVQVLQRQADMWVEEDRLHQERKLQQLGLW